MTELESRISSCKADIRFLQESLKQIEKEFEEIRWAPSIEVGDRHQDLNGAIRMYTEDNKWIFINTDARGMYSELPTDMVLGLSVKLFDSEILP